MTVAIALLLVILVVALILFSFEWVPPDVTALGVMLALVVLGLVPLDQAFAGFGSDTVMLLLGLLILTAALLRTGVIQMIERRMLQFTDPSRQHHSRRDGGGGAAQLLHQQHRRSRHLPAPVDQHGTAWQVPASRC